MHDIPEVFRNLVAERGFIGGVSLLRVPGTMCQQPGRSKLESVQLDSEPVRGSVHVVKHLYFNSR